MVLYYTDKYINESTIYVHTKIYFMYIDIGTYWHNDTYILYGFPFDLWDYYIEPYNKSPAVWWPKEKSLQRFLIIFTISSDHQLDIFLAAVSSSLNEYFIQLRDEFEDTEKMSTYLLAFVICDFDLKTKQTPTNNISVSVIASKDKIDQTSFALDTAVAITDYYEKFFKVKYPLPKQDLIAIPDFGAGAMENWGLITYRETALLYKEGVSAASNRQRIAIVVSHELAHQVKCKLARP